MPDAIISSMKSCQTWCGNGYPARRADLQSRRTQIVRRFTCHESVDNHTESRAVAHTRSLLQRSAAAIALVLALVSATLHVAAFDHANATAGVASMIMAIGCISCGVHLVREPTPRAWATLVGMSSAMIAIHLATMSMPTSHHEMSMSMPVQSQNSNTGSMTGLPTAMILVASIEMAFAMLLLWIATKRHGTANHDAQQRNKGTKVSRRR